MENERRKKLLETMKNFNKNQKDTILNFANETKDLEVIPIGVDLIDNFLGGGTKRGTYTIFWGGFSVGKTSLALQQIANAQKDGKICCYINLEKPIDQERFKQFGVNLDDLVLANHTKNAEQALTIIRTLCQEKVVDLIVLDSLNAMAPKGELESKTGKERDLTEKNIAELARVMSEFCRKVNPDIYNAKASVVIIGQTRIGGIGTFFTRATLSGGEAIKFYAYNMVFMRKGAKSDAPVAKFKEYYIDPEEKIRYSTKKESIGFDVCMRMDKTNSASSVRENEELHLPYLYEKGFVSELENKDSIVRIDPKANIEEKNKIEEYIIKNKKEDAEELGLIKSEQEKIDEEKEYTKQAIKKNKKKRGRPKKKKGE
ncbi:MAG: ATPase domain-containing protein [Candidatus Helarchaeota archaeon]